jgi:hypothetical protein
MYASLAFFALLSMSTLVLYLQRPTWITRVAYIFATALLLYTHVYATFVVIAQNVFVGYLIFTTDERFGRRTREWIIVQACILLFFAPWLPTMFSRALKVQEGFWIAPPSLAVLVGALHTIAGGVVATVLGLVALTGLFFGGLRSATQLPNGALGYSDKLLLLALWFGMPVILPFVLSFFLQPFFLSRYTIPASPAWQIAVALGIFRWCNGKVLPVISLTGLLTIAVIPEIRHAFQAPWNADWRGAVAYIEQNAGRHDQILFPAAWERRAYLFYSRREELPLVPYQRGASHPNNIKLWIVSSRHPRFCEENLDPKLGSVIQQKRFYGLAVCSFQAATAAKAKPSEH